MYTVGKYLKGERAKKKAENATRAQITETIKAPRNNMHERIKILHDTKGWRNRNLDLMMAHQQVIGILKELSMAAMARHVRVVRNTFIKVGGRTKGYAKQAKGMKDWQPKNHHHRSMG